MYYYRRKTTKYGNRKSVADGISFDSKHERDIYLKLKTAEKCGTIRDLQLQVPFVLQDKYTINGKTIRAIKYIADFTFINEQGQLEVWDAKGIKTDVYKLKKKIFEYKYGTEIHEV